MRAISQNNSIVNLCENCDIVSIIDVLCASLPNLVVHFSVCVNFHLIRMMIIFYCSLIACHHYCSYIKQVSIVSSSPERNYCAIISPRVVT